jgi:predicted GTPase
MDALVKTLPPPRSLEESDPDDSPLTVAIVGRPNVGEWCWQRSARRREAWVQREGRGLGEGGGML